jgi:hypothetical protein
MNRRKTRRLRGGRGDGNKTGPANVFWPPSDNEQSIDPILYALTTSMDIPASIDNPNTTQTLEYTKDKYNVRIRK